MHNQATVAKLFLLTLVGGLLISAQAQTGPNAPTEPPASGAIIVPPGTGEGEAIQKKAPPPVTVDPGMVTPPPAGKETKPNPQSAPVSPVPPPREKKNAT